MVTSASAEAEPRRSSAATGRLRARRSGWALLACCTVLLACAFMFGERASTLPELEAQVAAGDVRAVRLSGGMSSAGQGFSVVEVHWRHGSRAYTTKVIEARPRHEGREAADDGVTALIAEDLGSRLEKMQPGIRVDRVARSTGLSADAFGWHFTGWIFWALLFEYLCTLGLVIWGPEPRRATRWAWFWLISAAAPLTAMVFLVLGGAISRLPAHDTTRRLTGGWAFLLAGAIAAVLSGVS